MGCVAGVSERAGGTDRAGGGGRARAAHLRRWPSPPGSTSLSLEKNYAVKVQIPFLFLGKATAYLVPRITYQMNNT